MSKQLPKGHQTVHLHIGHPKTGSSYIQSLLSNNESLLRENGLIYPQSWQTEYSRRGGVTKGNAPPEILANRSFLKKLKGDPSDIILSSERLFYPLSENTAIVDRLKENFSRVRFLFFIRDPYDYIRSYYVQRVKTGDFNGSLDDYIVENDYCLHHLNRVLSIIKMARQEQCEMVVKNYSNLTVPISLATADFLKIEAERFLLPPHQTINRGLTEAELFLQREFNKHLGENRVAHSLISVPLCMRLPDLKATLPDASDQVYETVREKVNHKLVEVNSYLPEEERYVPIPERSATPASALHPGEITFRHDQIEILAQVISKAIILGNYSRSRQLRRKMVRSLEAIWKRIR